MGSGVRLGNRLQLVNGGALVSCILILIQFLVETRRCALLSSQESLEQHCICEASHDRADITKLSKHLRHFAFIVESSSQLLER